MRKKQGAINGQHAVLSRRSFNRASHVHMLNFVGKSPQGHTMSHVFLTRRGLFKIVGYTLSYLMECGHDFFRVLVGGYEWRRQH